MYHLRKLKSLLLLLFVAVTAQAQLEHGKVYNFVNIANSGKSMTALSPGALSIAPTSTSEFEQMWIAEVSDKGIALRNLFSGYYLHSPNATGNANWTLVSALDESCYFECAEVEASSGKYKLRAKNATDDSHYMHYGASTNRIVCWSAGTNNTASHWTIQECEKTEDITEQFNLFPNIAECEKNLTDLFEDVACSKLKSDYSTEEDLTASEAYKNLPTGLQNMALKVLNGNWAEDNYDTRKDGWSDSYAKKYRVQFYEPYNEPECAASALRMNAHSNLNNPTGIFANEGDVLYIMVDGEIKEGAALYLASYTGHNKLGGYKEGVQLKSGLNVVTTFENGSNYCINYVVHTFDTQNGTLKGNQAKARELSKFPDLKIHIEGGHINGYWNKMGDFNQEKEDRLYSPDTDEDWNYIEARATQTDVTVLGEYITLQFPLTDEGTIDDRGLGSFYNEEVSITASINEWDNVMMWERILLGVLDKDATEDETNNPKSPYAPENVPNVVAYTGDDTDDFKSGYGDYYNVHGLSFGTEGGYMYGGWDHCGYNFNTMGSIMVNMVTQSGPHWGPAHEMGHQHQALLNLEGLWEVTNNLFSNVVLWYFGESTSRVNGTEGSLSSVLAAFNTDGSDFYTNNIWGLTHMYYKLFLYYHVLGHNPKFYPRLFEMLRQDPMAYTRITQDGAGSLLHFYKKCCMAAGEDLTEFFRAHGLLSVMNNRYVGDYYGASYTMTQAQIDAAIKEVKDLAKEKGWKENIAVLFVNDATGESILSHKEGVESLSIFDTSGGKPIINAELGGYASFAEATSANYTCSMSGNTVTMTGKGGVGFAIFNEKGELIAFSDKKSFEISSECAAAIMSGTATISAMTAGNEKVEIEYDEVEAKAALLGGLIEEVDEIIALSDADNTKPGFYKTSALTELQKAYDFATKVYGERISTSYTTAYEVLNREYVKILALTTDKTPFLPGSTYVLSNKRHSGKSMTINATDTLYCADTNLEDAKQQWIFEAATEEDTYYLKNVSNKKYLRTLSKSGKTDALAASTADAFPYKLFDLGYGLWALQCQNDIAEKVSLHCDDSKNIVGWWHTSNDNDGSWWYLTATQKDESALPLYNLQDLVAKTENMIDLVGSAKEIKLQAEHPDSAYYLYCNALYNKTAGNNNGDNSMNTAKLLDGNPNTHIHTDYRTNNSYVADDDLDHYLRIDMGQGNSISKFKFTYTTRNVGDSQAHPKTIEIAGSNELDEEFTVITTLPLEGESLPGANTNNDGRGVYTSPEEITSSEPYRYIRFMVTETHGGTEAYGNHPYFYMAEFNLLTKSDVKVDAEYAGNLTAEYLGKVFESLLSAKKVLADANADQYQATYEALSGYYNALLEIYSTSKNTALDEKKERLNNLIKETEDLIEQCGTVTYTPGTFDGKAPLQTTKREGDFYVWTNAQSTNEGPIANLIDGNQNTYFHSDYSGFNSTDGLDHHITVNLGENNKAKEFTFKYITRHNADTNYPKTIKVWGSVDGNTYKEITSVTGLPVGNTQTYLSDRITATTYYSYLRFMVTENNNTDSSKGVKGGHHIFHMAEFELDVIGTPDSYTAELKSEAGDAGTDLLIETFKKNAEAQGVYDYATTELQVEAAIAKLQTQYDKLLAAQQSSDKATLRDLVARTTELIEECGTLSYAETPTKVNLQAKNSTSNLYLSCPYLFYDINDNPGDSDTDCADLLDGNTDTYIHTNYNALLNTYPHYLQVTFGASEIPLQFKFSYSTRHNGANQVPKHIVVKGSNDGENFDKILAEFDDESDGMPTTMNTSWTAPNDIIGYYKYLRFYVTESPQTKPYFAMSEFSMSYTGYAIKWNNAQHGTATNDHLIAAYEARNAANELLATTTTKDNLQTATTALQEKYTELYNAKKNINFTISSNVSGGGVRYNEVDCTETLTAPSTLTASELKAIPLDGYVASITVADGVITIIYNKVYTVQVVGVEGQGGVKLGETTYAGGATFDMLESSFKIDNFSAIPVDGYAPYKTFDGSTITVTYKKVYNVVVEGVDAANGGVVFENNNYTHGQELHALDLVIGNLTAIGVTGYVANVSLEGTTITVTYNKIYTVQIVGLDGQGSVQFGDDSYNHGQELNALNLEVGNLTAIVPEGYVANVSIEGATITVTYKKVYTVQVVGGEGDRGVIFEESTYADGEEIHVLGTLNADQLQALSVDGYAAYVSVDDATITITYNKIYIVQVVGLDGQGGVQFGDDSYNHGQELNALNLQVGNLTAIVPEGYVANVSIEGATITVTYKKVYTVQVIGGEGDRGVTFEGNTYTNNAEVHVLGTLNADQLQALSVDGYAAYVSVDDATINVVYKMIYHVQVVGGDSNGGVIFEENTYASDEVHALSAIALNQLTAVEVSGYVGTITLDGRTICVTYCKLVQDLLELRNYKAYHIRAKSGEGYFAYNSSITEDYISLRGVTNWSYQQLPSNETVANKYTEAVSLSDKTVAWQIIQEDDNYYLYQPEKKAYVTRDNGGRDYKFTAEKTALDGIRQNIGEGYVATFGIHAGGGYSETSQDYACICTGETPFAVRDWTWDDHGAVLQIIENPYVYALDYEVKVVGNANGSVDFEDESYADGETLSATELLTASDLTVKSIGGYEHEIKVNKDKDNATITITYTAIDKTELINLITETQTLVDDASGYLGSSLNVTDALIEETNEVLATAIEVRDNSSANREEYEAALAALQAAKSKLATAIAYAELPVQLTFDVNSPVTYKITICRDNSPVLAYDNNSSMVAVTAFELGNKAHGWYFMAATDGKVYIMPYYNQNTTLALSTNSFSEGNSKVKGMAIDSEGYTQEWTITNANMNEDNRNAGWYNITTLNPDNVNTTWYFSNHGGAGNKMGFYNYPNDGGSRFKFEATSFDKSAAYYTLYNYYTSRVKVATCNIVGGDAVGYYPVDKARAYNNAYNTATSCLENTTATDEDYTSAYNALVAANEALELIMPSADKFYRFVSVVKGNTTNAYVYANPADNKMYWATDKTASDATAIWTFVPSEDGKFAVSNLHTGSSINTFIDYNPTPLSETAGEVSIVSLSANDGQIGIKCGARMMHAQGNGNAGSVVHWGTGANDASAWRIVEVTEDELKDVKFALSIGQYHHAGLYLNYATKIPEGVKVYIVHTPDEDKGIIMADELVGTILPARTAVIVKNFEEEYPVVTYNFVYTAQEYDVSEEILKKNQLRGSAYLKYQQVKEEGNLCCVFGQKGGVVGLYKNYVQYVDANGSTTKTEGEGENATTTNYADSDNGTHFKISANKVYYEYKPTDEAGAAAFRFSFNDATGIDKLMISEDTLIYNPYGQRLLEIVEPGIYIINGKKVYVTEKMIGNNN